MEARHFEEDPSNSLVPSWLSRSPCKMDLSDSTAGEADDVLAANKANGCRPPKVDGDVTTKESTVTICNNRMTVDVARPERERNIFIVECLFVAIVEERGEDSTMINENLLRERGCGGFALLANLPTVVSVWLDWIRGNTSPIPEASRGGEAEEHAGE